MSYNVHIGISPSVTMQWNSDIFALLSLLTAAGHRRQGYSLLHTGIVRRLHYVCGSWMLFQHLSFLFLCLNLSPPPSLFLSLCFLVSLSLFISLSLCLSLFVSFSLSLPNSPQCLCQCVAILKQLLHNNKLKAEHAHDFESAQETIQQLQACTRDACPVFSFQCLVALCVGPVVQDRLELREPAEHHVRPLVRDAGQDAATGGRDGGPQERGKGTYNSLRGNEGIREPEEKVCVRVKLMNV